MGRRRIHFATNRVWDRHGGAFGDRCEAPETRLWLGTVAVETTADPLDAGRAGPPEVAGYDDFLGAASEAGAAAGVLGDWLAAAAGRDAVPLFLVHGFNYRFEEACARAGQICDSYEAISGVPLEPLAFAWPSDGDLSPDAYGRDRRDCAASGPALARLVHRIAAARAVAGAGRKPAWLAHSMGVHATCCAMQALAAGPEAIPERLFGQAVLVAGDEEPDVLSPGTAGRLRPMLTLADWTTIGVYAEDTTLNLMSGWLQGNGARLGAVGPTTAPAPGGRCFVVDYGMAVDHRRDIPGGTTWNDVAHQYYRADPRAMRDLALALSGGTSPDAVEGRRWGRRDERYASREEPGRLYVV